MLSYRYPSSLLSVATGLGRVVATRVRQAIVEARKESQEKKLAADEKQIKERNPYGVDSSGCFDLYRSDHYQKAAAGLPEKEHA